MTLTAEASNPLSLDEVRAKIFYLASDVELASPPTAMLLRAVADAIEDGAIAPVELHAANGNAVPLLLETARMRRLAGRASGSPLRPFAVVTADP